jgi:hypothetical protein
MSGIALYGDLGSAIGSTGSVVVGHCLESVKILPNLGSNTPDLYGARVAQATSLVEIAQPERSRSIALAVTAALPKQDPDHVPDFGLPTSWSSTIDALAAGRAVDTTEEGLVYIDEPADRSARLFLVSAGNVRVPFDVDHLTRSDLEPVEDPGQSWNALTVGAFTEQFDLSHDVEPFPQWSALAPVGELSPVSRTSVAFKRSWPLKPEVVFEGGNVAVDPSGKTIDSPAGLQLLTTRMLGSGGLLTTSLGTSPATAKAAHMAASISLAYPSLWPETVRALMVHSARWTDKMLAPLQAPSRTAKVAAIRRYGWGVPAMDRALRSATDAVTLVAQDQIHPYVDGKMREMHLHELPWPSEALEELGDQQVSLRVALSYFIEPNPARRGWVRRFRYASHGLRFEARRATESTHEFRQRINRLALAEDEERPRTESDAGQWLLGPNERVKGSLHVDLWTGPAVELAARGVIAVYPVTGWWKEQPKRDRSDHGARYSLVVSIEAPEVDVDIWTPVAVAAQVPIAVETEIET